MNTLELSKVTVRKVVDIGFSISSYPNNGAHFEYIFQPDDVTYNLTSNDKFQRVIINNFILEMTFEEQKRLKKFLGEKEQNKRTA